jgi:cell division septum initiation protein DivIVA
MNKTAPTLEDYEKALHQMLDENEALRAEIAKLKGQLSADALATLQGVYLNPDEPAANRIKAAAAAIGYERPKLAATASLVVVDFRERVRQARLKAPFAKTIEHLPEPV